MATFTAALPNQNPPVEDWNQYMQWDGQDDSAIDLKDSTLGSPLTVSSKTGKDFSQPTTPYPISPSTTHNGDHQSQFSSNYLQPTTQHVTDLPTPGHSSNSSNSPSLPHARLSGETLWDRNSLEFPPSGTKRKFSEGTASSEEARNKAAQKPAPKKRPHNIIEKRYRANLNEKIAELRDSVPSLRIARKGADNKDENDEEDEEGDGVTPTNKLNKASILTKATEYIKHLELRNRKLDDENKSLKQRLLKLERVIAQGGANSSSAGDGSYNIDTTSEPAVEPVNKDSEAAVDTKNNPPQGLIPVPEMWRKLRATASQSTEHYGHVYDNANEGTRRGGWTTKLMVGSLAGLMIMEGFAESDHGSESAKRGLFGIPLEFLDGWWFLRSPKDFISAFMMFCRSGGFLPMLKGFTALSIVAFLMMSYLFNSKPKTTKAESAQAPERAPSLASPIEVRRAAWSTSTQVLRIPSHSFFPEWIALTSEWFKYTVHLLLGWSMYSWITGRTGEDELARVKAWDIAIDAQLAGGDAEISRSRVILTIFASGLLPLTPARLMLKALHCRLVLYGTARKGSALDRMWNRIATFLAEYQWRLAQQLHGTLPIGHPDRLPRYSAALLARDCKDVMLDSILLRAFNLLYDRPTNEGSEPEDALMDVVVEDHAVRSPLDALSAWFSSYQLREALIASLDHSPENVSHEFDYLLHSAIAIAPEGSAVHVRAIAVKSVFFDGMRGVNMQTVLDALPSSRSLIDSDAQSIKSELPVFIDSSTPLSACPEIEIVLHCAKTMAVLQGATQNEDLLTQRAVTMFAYMPVNPVNLTLLGFAPIYYVLRQLTDGLDASDIEEVTSFSRLIRVLYHWSKIEGPDSVLLAPGVFGRIQRLYEIQEKRGVSLSRRQSSMSHDTGYVSSGEMEEASTTVLL